MTTLFNEKNADALFNEDETHRIWLYRIWDDSKPLVMFIGFNPSSANSFKDDPTIRRVKSFAAKWGYGGVYMMNLFTFISTDPTKLNIENGNIPDADKWLLDVGALCDKIVFAWGGFKTFGRDKEVKVLFPTRFALHVNNNGSPNHPLYVKGNILPIPY